MPLKSDTLQHHHRRSRLTILAFLAAAWMVDAGRAESVLLNGSFEVPAMAAANSSIMVAAGSTQVSGWTNHGPGPFFWLNGNAGIDQPGPRHGQQYVNFNGADMVPGTAISQTFATVVGGFYRVRFSVGRGGSGGGELSVTATVLSTNGGLLGSRKVLAGDTVGWSAPTLLGFIATTPATTLRFEDTSRVTENADVVVDDVSVELDPVESDPCASAQASLVARWRGENNALDSAGANHGTLINGATFAAGRAGSAFRLDGSNYVATSLTTAPPLSNQVTVEAWIQSSGTPYYSGIVHKFDSFEPGAGTGFAVSLDGEGSAGRMRADFGQGATYQVARHPAYVLDGAWHHVVATCDGTTLLLYVDGVAGPPTNAAFLLTNTRPVLIGVDPAAEGRFFSGLIDEVSIYNRSMSPGEVAALYATGSASRCPPTNCVPPPAGNVAWWRGENNALDSAGANHGTLIHDVAFAAGRVGSAFRLNGSNYVETSLSTAPQFSNQVTMEAWIQSTGSGAYSAIIYKFDYPPNPWTGFGLNLDGNLLGEPLAGRAVANFGKGTSGVGGTDWVNVKHPAYVLDGAWHHLVATCDGQTARLYVDGVASPPYDATGVVLSNAIPVFIGFDPGHPFEGNGRYFNGLIDEAAVYNRALSADEVLQRYAAGIAGRCVADVYLLVNGMVVTTNIVTVTNRAVIDLRSMFPGGHIFFTLDGSSPEQGVAYAEPFTLEAGAIVRAVAFAADFAVAAVVDPVVVNVLRPPVIVAQPEDRRALVGAVVEFAVAAAGEGPLQFQWLFNGAPLADATNAMLPLVNVQANNAGNFAVVVTNALGAVTSRVARLEVLAPAGIDAQPASLSVAPGSNVTFCVTATGTEPIRYQWRLNGLSVPGETNRCLTLTNVQVTNSGSYSVVVANEAGAVLSDSAELEVEVGVLQPADNFADRVPLPGSSGLRSGTNTAATREANERLHAGKPGSNSVWYTWHANASGILTLDLRGSGFDTLLAVYTGASLETLVPIASDEDSGGFYTSFLNFNVAAGTDYAVAIDGLGGASGRFVLRWDFEGATEIIPAIATQPRSVAASLGGAATFGVLVTPDEPGIRYQWLFNSLTNAGATNRTLVISNVAYAHVGDYRVRVTHTNNPMRFVESASAALEIGPESRVVSYDKLEDLLNAETPAAGGGEGFVPASAAPAGGFISVRLGSFNSQVLGNTNSGTQAREPSHCNFIGAGRTRWFGLRITNTLDSPLTNASVVLDTVGSGIETVLTAYHWTNYDNLANAIVGCDIDTQPGSRVEFALPPLGIHKRRDYLVAIDSVGSPLIITNADGSTNPVGLIRLNWRLGTPPVITNVSPNQFLAEGAAVTLRVTAGQLIAAGVTNPISPPAYQWSFNGAPLAGASWSSLALPVVRLAHAGRYAVTVGNDFGTVSAAMQVAVLQTNMVSRQLALGEGITLGVTLSGGAACGPGYRWFRNGALLAGRNGPTFSLDRATAQDAGLYAVVVTNCFGAITSTVAIVQVAIDLPLAVGGQHPGHELRFPPVAWPVCAVVLECATDLFGPQTPWQAISTNFNLQAPLVLPLEADRQRFYRARLVPCPP